MSEFRRVDNRFAARLDDLRVGSVAVFGVGIDANSSHLFGAATAPAAIRAQLHSGSGNYTSEDGTNVEGLLVEIGDVVVENRAGSTTDFDAITAAVGAIVDAGAAPLALGGDHSVTYPILRSIGPRHPGLTIVHVDAHPDLYDDLDGNPLSHASPFARIMEAGLCTRLVQIGIRTATAHQREQADRFGVETVEARTFDGFDPASVAGPTYVSIDLDGIDPAFAPGVSHHEPGGLTTRQTFDLIAALPGPIVGADIVELNPTRDVVDMTATVAAKLAKELAAKLTR